MKFWQKIFISVFLLFLVSINLSMFAMMNLFSETTSKAEEESAINGAYIAESSLYNEFISYERYNTLQHDNKRRCFFFCSSTYQYKKIYLQYYENDDMVFSSFPDDALTFDWSQSENVTNYLNGDSKLLHITNKGIEYIAVRVYMNYPFDNQSLVYINSLEQYEERKNVLVKGFLFIEVLFALSTFVLLYIIVRKVTNPLPKLSETVSKIAAGKYDEKLPVSGKDEIAVLSGKINDLSDKISDSIMELKKSSEEKQNFIDDLGHEIRTPLTTISGYADYLRMAVTTEDEKKRSLDYIIAESHRLEHLSSTLLELASIREGKIQKTQVDAQKTVDYIKNIFEPRCRDTGIQFIAECDTDFIFSDKDMILILISNLIENAIRASNKGGLIELYVRNMRAMGYKKTVISVKDHGIGMRQEDIDRIAEPFYRVDKARSRESGGVGLGVSLCKQIIKVNDGTMKYESVLNKGTTVTIVLPESDDIFQLT